MCDPCCLNCFNEFRAYFDSSNDYLGTNEQRPPGGFNFAYYTAVVVKPKGAANSDTDCHATSLDCTYYSSVPVTESGSHPAPFPRGSRR